MADLDCLAYEARVLRFDPLKLKQAESLLYGGCAVATAVSAVGKSAGAHAEASTSSSKPSSLVQEIAQARKRIEESLREPIKAVSVPSAGGTDPQVLSRIEAIESHNKALTKQVESLSATIKRLEELVHKLTPADKKTEEKPPQEETTPKHKDDEEGDDDEEVDLFGSDDDEPDEEAEKLKAERLAAYAAKKAKKPGPIAKSSIIFDVKPWDDETDMGEVEKNCRTIEMDGMVWGASKLVPLAYGIKKLQIMCTIEDEKVSVDELQEKIEEFEDFVQSVDIAAFNKV